MIDMGPAYAPTWEGRPTRLTHADWLLWQQVKAEIIQDATSLYYDVGLGAGGTIPENTPERMARMWTKNTQKRADIIISTPTRWQIVEVRTNAGSGAIGSLLLYEHLFLEEKRDNKPTKKILVTDRDDADLRALARSYDIDYILP